MHRRKGRLAESQVRIRMRRTTPKLSRTSSRNVREHPQVNSIDRFAAFERRTKSLLDAAVGAPRKNPKAKQDLGVCRITDTERAGAAVTAALDSRKVRLIVDNVTSFEEPLSYVIRG